MSDGASKPADHKKREIDAVRDFVKGSGYPLEYQAARHLSEVGFSVAQGAYYRDPEDPSKTREVDVLATIEKLSIGLEVIVECKHNPTPWVVLTRQVDPTPGDGIPSALFSRASPAQVRTRLGAGSSPDHLNVPSRHGFLVVAVRNDGKQEDHSWTALNAVVKAAVTRLERKRRVAPPTMAIPIIVIDGSLYQLGYRDDGTELLEPVVWQRVIWNGSTVRRANTAVDIVTIGHLGSYARNLLSQMGRLSELLQPR